MGRATKSHCRVVDTRKGICSHPWSLQHSYMCTSKHIHTWSGAVIHPVIESLRSKNTATSKTPMLSFGRPKWVDHEVRSLRPAWPTWWNPVSTENTKISWVYWHTPVMPATQEAETEESLEPGRWSQWAEIKPLYSSLGEKKRKKEKKYLRLSNL